MKIWDAGRGRTSAVRMVRFFDLETYVWGGYRTAWRRPASTKNRRVSRQRNAYGIVKQQRNAQKSQDTLFVEWSLSQTSCCLVPSFEESKVVCCVCRMPERRATSRDWAARRCEKVTSAELVTEDFSSSESASFIVDLMIEEESRRDWKFCRAERAESSTEVLAAFVSSMAFNARAAGLLWPGSGDTTSNTEEVGKLIDAAMEERIASCFKGCEYEEIALADNAVCLEMSKGDILIEDGGEGLLMAEAAAIDDANM